MSKSQTLDGRLTFLEQLESSVERLHRRKVAGPVAVLLGQVDGFDLMNDWYGYREVESLLQRVHASVRAQLQDLSTACAGSFLLGRCSNGGFAVALFGNLACAAATIAENLWQGLQGTYMLDGQPRQFSCSVGCTRPDALPNPDHLLAWARAALRRAMEMGGNRVEIAPHEGIAAHARTRILGRDLQLAVSHGQLRLEYQPIINVEHMTMEGVEALLRWDHPLLGTVSPTEFIPIAAESGCLGQLGDWVLKNACLEFVAMRSDPRLRELGFVSVNVSRQNLGDRNLGEKVLSALSAAALEPRQLHLEITESELGRNLAAAALNVHAIRKLGVGIAIDDFGVGYSSLASLHQFPVDMLKLDRSFLTRDFTSNQGRGILAIAHAVVNLARDVDLRVVAEGVETPEQIALLQSMQCPLAQGYFLCRPMSARDLPLHRIGSELGMVQI
jgi:EAL domain-containing protein (putative c-di-GMP-specific phosphodiesterase class I)/GGDEF domain-containing protein